jgi:hypothetical protein
LCQAASLFSSILYINALPVYRYPSLNLAEVYATIAFHLRHQPEVEIYLQQRQQRSQEVRAMNQAKFDPQGLRDRLLARKREQEAC